jgi:hypothetical protein
MEAISPVRKLLYALSFRPPEPKGSRAPIPAEGGPDPRRSPAGLRLGSRGIGTPGGSHPEVVGRFLSENRLRRSKLSATPRFLLRRGFLFPRAKNRPEAVFCVQQRGNMTRPAVSPLAAAPGVRIAVPCRERPCVGPWEWRALDSPTR